MDNPVKPSAHTVQPASPDTPQYNTPISFPTAAHPMPSYSPKWLAIATSFVVLFIFTILGIMFIMGIQNNSPYEKEQSLNKKTTIFLSPTKAPSQDLYAMQSYYNDQYGLSFKYPAGWTILYPELTPGILLIMTFSPTGSGVLCTYTDKNTSSCDLQQSSVSIIENNTNQTVEQFLDYMGLPYSIERISTTINGYIGIETITKNANYEYESIYVSANNKIFQFTNIRSLDNTYAKELFNQMLQSIKFISVLTLPTPSLIPFNPQ